MYNTILDERDRKYVLGEKYIFMDFLNNLPQDEIIGRTHLENRIRDINKMLKEYNDKIRFAQLEFDFSII